MENLQNKNKYNIRLKKKERKSLIKQYKYSIDSFALKVIIGIMHVKLYDV